MTASSRTRVELESFAQLLRHHRQEAGWTQEELAERAGISPRGLRYLEGGTRLPYRDTVQRLARALELRSADLARFARAGSSRGQGVERVPLLPAVPAWSDEIIGRAEELDELTTLLRGPARLVTLTGTGGVGKTRLAAEVAEQLEPEFADGVAWVTLAGVDDPALVAEALAHSLGAGETPGLSDAELAVWRLAGRQLLLVVDNFEHVLPAASVLGGILVECPDLKVLVTSRASLRLAAEHEYELGPLAGDPAVHLFLRRAQAIDHRFALTEGNEGAVKEICRRVDGLPLALELAAARVRTLGPAEMLGHLEHRLALLSAGPVDSPERQRTLRSTLDWSYRLLRPSEQRLLRGLAVFASGATLRAIAEVCMPGEDLDSEVVDTLDTLRRNSLLQRLAGTGPSRYTLLETVREYALDALAAFPDEGAQLAARHAAHYGEVAVELGRRLEGPSQPEAMRGLETEHDNIRAALRWFIRTGATAEGLRVASALWMFWYIRGYATEGRAHLAALLALPGDRVPGTLRAAGLLAAGQLARAQGDNAVAARLMDESLALYRESDDPAELAGALLGSAFVARMQDDSARAEALLREGLAPARATGHLYMTAAILHHLGMIALERDDRARARALLEESLSTYRRLGFPRFIGLLLATIGGLERAVGNRDRSRALLFEALDTLLASGERLEIHWALDELAHLAADEGLLERAVTLAGAAAELRERIRAGSLPEFRRRRELWLAEARGRLGEAAFEAARTAGEALSPDAAIAYAKDPDAGRGSVTKPTRSTRSAAGLVEP